MKHSSINFRSIAVQPAWLLSSLWTGLHKDPGPIINNPVLGRSCQARRAAERSTWTGPSAVQYQLFYCSFSARSTQRASESMNEAGNAEKQKERNKKSSYLTRSQSTFLKKGWPMMSAKPVWGWQPRRSLGSCRSKGESKVRDGVRWWAGRQE